LASVAIHCSGIGAADAVRVGNEAGRSPMVQQVAGTMTSTTTRRDDAPRERAAFQPRLELCGGGHQRGALAIRDVPYLLPASHPSRRRINYPKTNTCTARATASSTNVNTAPTLKSPRTQVRRVHDPHPHRQREGLACEWHVERDLTHRAGRDRSRAYQRQAILAQVVGNGFLGRVASQPDHGRAAQGSTATCTAVS